MPRLARQLSQTGLYHIVFRGINRQNIFEEDTDYQKMIDILKDLKVEMTFEIYVYCFMNNHVHFLLKEKNRGDISLIMKRLLTKYVKWYNKKYSRIGTLIANRYKSHPVEIDKYFLSVVRYIHQNPIRAKIVERLEDYKWSSYNEYITGNKIIADKSSVLKMINKNNFEDFHQHEETEIFTVSDNIKIADDSIRRNILKSIGIEPKEIVNMDKNKRNIILNKLKKEYSIRQLERVTGISRGIIMKS